MSYSSLILREPSLVLYWKLDELGSTIGTVSDSSPNGNDGSYAINRTGSPTGTTVHHPTLGVASLLPSDVGTAAQFFGGLNDFDSTADNAGAGPDPFRITTGKMTIEFWVNTTSEPTLGFNNISMLVTADDGGGAGYRVFSVFLDAGGVATYQVWSPGGYNTVLQGATVINDGVNHQIVGTYDASDLYLYVDGLLDATTPTTLPGALEPNGLTWFMLGSGPPIGGGYFNRPTACVLDEVSLYEDALPAATILNHFNAGEASPAPAMDVAYRIGGE